MSSSTDKTGHNRLSSNLIISWATHFFILIVGFVVPRQISDSLGQVSLGVWDFCWATVRYLSMTGVGFVGALSRYTSLYRASESWSKLEKTFSTTVVWQVVIALIVLAITYALSRVVPQSLVQDHVEMIPTTAAVIFLLGSSLVVEIIADPARAIITGFHRWDINNYIHLVVDVGTGVTMIAALFMGADLVRLALITLLFAVAGAILRGIGAIRVFPQLSFSFSSFRWKTARELLRFGVKTILVAIPTVIAIQGISIAVGILLGPAALAMFTRPIAISRHIDTLNRKYTFMVSGVAGGLEGAGRKDEIAELLVNAGRTSFLLVLPMLLTLGVFGEDVIRFWMGPEYVRPFVAAVVAIAFFLPAIGLSATHTLAGLNRHGQLAMRSLGVALVLTLASVAYFSMFGVTLELAAIFLGITVAISTGILPIYMACSQLDVRLRDYFMRALGVPLVVGGLLLFVFLGLRHALTDYSYLGLIASAVVGGLIMAPIYWKYVLDDNMRSVFRQRISETAGRLEDKV